MIYYFKEKRYNELTKHYIATQTEFDFIRVIGEGAYGVAYLVTQPKTKQSVVLKRLKAKHLKAKKCAAFQQEIHFLKRLQHLPVPNIIATGMIEKAPFYLMSYVEGKTFEHAIFRENVQFSIKEALHFTRILLAIIRDIHSAHIVHRDLRIPNIILKNGQLTIIDFGLATTIEASFSVTAMKNPKKVPHPVSDLYAAGHFLLFLLYSQYKATARSTSWQQELQLPTPLHDFLERLLTIEEPFLSASEALAALRQIDSNI